MGSTTSTTQWLHSEVLDRSLWADNPEYLLTIPPRISKYNERSDDASIQLQIDVAGKENVGVVDGAITSVGSLAALMYPDCLPDRMAATSYVLETTFIWDDLNIPEPDEVAIKDSESNTRKDVNIFHHPSMKVRLKQAFSKGVAAVSRIDPILGPSVLETWKDWRLAETDIRGNFFKWTSLDQYVEVRVRDIGYPCVIAMGLFSCNLKITPEEEAIALQIAWPLHAQGVYSNDYYSWFKELRAHQESGGKIPIINSVKLLQRLEGLSVEEARARLREKSLEMEAEYHRRKKEYFEANADKGISPALVRYLDYHEQYATGHVIWCLNSYRNNSPGGDEYRAYYAKRVAEGAIFWDNPSQSEDILTDGYQVRYLKK
ncbi:uncharacterized protein N7458_004058 [Penicillium daleae]|uniref:Terpenoid synthase n=1 Tax=Penicillium daleae TaxID=63821 RepID=A0AAD6CA82_9EURO|nr:uncharacterized protein N7458_004058 [Penicillium daleae]KAJ5455794.1 hypothetical protein N7458_004058 [Penicillium daleae]